MVINLLSIEFPGKTARDCLYSNRYMDNYKRIQVGILNSYVSLTRVQTSQAQAFSAVTMIIIDFTIL